MININLLNVKGFPESTIEELRARLHQYVLEIGEVSDPNKLAVLIALTRQAGTTILQLKQLMQLEDQLLKLKHPMLTTESKTDDDVQKNSDS